jgi:predicted nucleic acid-binding protein
MKGLADADLVTALVKPTDHLRLRAEAHVRQHDLRVPFSVGIELLFVAEKFGLSRVDFIGAASQRFKVDQLEVLRAAANAMDEGEVRTVFDAVHAAQALVEGTTLHTTDKRLLASEFPTTPF